MPSATHDFRELTEHIENLEPEQIAPEIGDIVARGDKHSPLAQIIAKNRGGEFDGDDPVTELLGTVETVIDRAPSQAIKAGLGEKALGSVVNVISSPSPDAPSMDSTRRLAHQAAQFARFDESPRHQAWNITAVGKGVVVNAGGAAARGATQDTLSLLEVSSTYFREAAESAQLIPDPSSRSNTFRWIAEQASRGVQVTERIQHEGGDTIFTQPIPLFQEARESAKLIEDGSERFRERMLNAENMATAAIDTAEADETISAILKDMAVSEIDDVLEAYQEGDLQAVKSAEACFQLADFGVRLAKRVKPEFGQASGRTKAVRNQLADSVVSTLTLARDKARAVEGERPRFGAARKSSSLSNMPSHNATSSAHNLIELNADAAKQVLALGFDIAIAEDIDRNGRYSDSSNSVLNSIDRMAEADECDPKLSFELFALAHGLERGRVGEDGVSHLIEVNARRWLHTVRGYNKIVLDAEDGTDREFVEFAIRIAGQDNHWGPNLRDLTRAFEAYPELCQQANDQINHLSKQQKTEREPKTQAAHLAREIIQRM